jgi:hypothetical protein
MAIAPLQWPDFFRSKQENYQIITKTNFLLEETMLRIISATMLLFFIVSLPLLGQEKTSENDKYELLLKKVEMLQKEIELIKTAQQQKISSLEKQVSLLSQELAKAQEKKSEPGSVKTVTTQSPKQRDRSVSNIFNPRINLISDMLAGYTSQGDESKDDLLMREMEIGFSGAVDTWGRYDATFTLHNHPELGFAAHDHAGEDHESEHEHGSEGVTLEEGYFTFLELPADLQARVGKFRTAFGRTNEYHPHSIPWVDYPLVIKNYLGEEGLIGTGSSLSYLLPADQYTEFTYEFFRLNGEAESGVFNPEAEDYGHLIRGKTFFEFSDTTTLELGASSMVSPVTDEYAFDDNWLNGLDFTLKWAPLGDGSFRKFEWRTELFGLRKSMFHEEHHDDDHDHDAEVEHELDHDMEIERENLFGFYSSIDYRLNQFWNIGGRYDYVENPFELEMNEKALSLYLTWWQSEYAFWRLGLMRSIMEHEGIEEDAINGMFLQFNISLGPHPAHKY